MMMYEENKFKLEQPEIRFKLVNNISRIVQMMYTIQLELEECKCLARLRANETDQVENNTRMYDIQDKIEKLRNELHDLKEEIK